MPDGHKVRIGNEQHSLPAQPGGERAELSNRSGAEYNARERQEVKYLTVRTGCPAPNARFDSGTVQSTLLADS
jgi:hypothetical protein